MAVAVSVAVPVSASVSVSVSVPVSDEKVSGAFCIVTLSERTE
jgi:hypothetical protein